MQADLECLPRTEEMSGALIAVERDMAGEHVPILSFRLKSDLVCLAANLVISPVIAQVDLLRTWPARSKGGKVDQVMLRT